MPSKERPKRKIYRLDPRTARHVHDAASRTAAILRTAVNTNNTVPNRCNIHHLLRNQKQNSGAAFSTFTALPRHSKKKITSNCFFFRREPFCCTGSEIGENLFFFVFLLVCRCVSRCYPQTQKFDRPLYFEAGGSARLHRRSLGSFEAATIFFMASGASNLNISNHNTNTRTKNGWTSHGAMMAVAVHASQLQFLDRNFPCSGCYCYRCVVRFLLAMLNVLEYKMETDGRAQPPLRNKDVKVSSWVHAIFDFWCSYSRHIINRRKEAVWSCSKPFLGTHWTPAPLRVAPANRSTIIR